MTAAAPAAVIFGLAALQPSDWERRFLAETSPFGFILFKRNLGDAAQISDLCAELRAIVGRADAPILIDQEGGRVQRLGPPDWAKLPEAGAVGALAARDPAAGARAAWLLGRLAAAQLRPLGIDVDCAPVLDLLHPGADAVIGDRAFGADPDQAARLGRACAEGLLDGGVRPVIKHLPGHGRAEADSHEALPVVATPIDALERTDLAPFRALSAAPGSAALWGMTAHLVLTDVDPARPATCSPAVIAGVIRGRIGFDGLLMSDDLSMKALSGRLEDRARDALAAGCDLVLHCNGDPTEMQAVAAGARPLDAAALRRIAANPPLAVVPGFDAADGLAELHRLLAV